MRISPEDRDILRLAIPALGALAAEPLFVLADSAIVGRLGTDALAGLGAAGAILTTVVGLCVFLAYGTTASVARLIGAGHPRRALTVGVDGCWLAVVLGLVLAMLGWVLAEPLIRALGARGMAASHAVDYLHASLPGLPGMLLVLAATGVLRGQSDARTPLRVAVTGALANIPLNWLLVYPAGFGVAGSGLGTAVVQLAMAAALAHRVTTQARAIGARLTPDLPGIVASARTGAPLLIRTLALRVALLGTTGVAAQLGATGLAAHQVTMAVWSFLALSLDAIAIAAQTLTGLALGAGDAARARSVLRRMVGWGCGFGIVVALALLAVHRLLPGLFSTDPAVQSAISLALVVAAVGQPISGYVFVLDGVLMGAGDGRFLAVASILCLLGYLPALWAVDRFAPASSGIGWLWAAFAIWFLVLRAATLGWRQRQGGWTRVGG